MNQDRRWDDYTDDEKLRMFDRTVRDPDELAGFLSVVLTDLIDMNKKLQSLRVSVVSLSVCIIVLGCILFKFVWS